MAARKIGLQVVKHSKTRAKPTAKRVPSEHHEQVVLVARVRWVHPEWLLMSIPNGLPLTAMQRIRAVAEGLLPGAPDLYLAEPRGGFHGLFVELKRTTGGVQSPAQRLMAKALQDRGYDAVFATGAEAAYKKMRDYMALSTS